MSNAQLPQRVAQDDLLVELMRDLAAGDSRALSAIYRATSGGVYALALRILRDRAAAEDVVATVYTDAWRRAADYDPSRGSVRAWLMVMCRSRALDTIRAGAALRLEALHSYEEESDDSAPDPCDLLAATRRSSCVHTCIARLAPLDRQMLGLAFFRGHTHSEIAEHMDMPLGSVKTRLRRSLQILRACVAESGQD